MNSYSLDKNILTIRTECGEYKFKIDDDEKLANASRTADLMVNEMGRVDKKITGGKNQPNPYAKLLQANLNISDKYIQLEQKYQRLVQKNEERKAYYLERFKSIVASKQNLTSEKTADEPSFPDDHLPQTRGSRQEQSRTELACQEKTEPGGMGKGQEKELKREPEPRAKNEPGLERDVKPQDREGGLEPPPLHNTKQASRPKPVLEPTPEPTQQPASELELEPAQTPEPDLELESAQTPEPDLDLEPEPESESAPRAPDMGSPEPRPDIPLLTREPNLTGSVPPASSASPSRLRINNPQERPEKPVTSDNGARNHFQLPGLDFLKNGQGKTEVDHEAIRRDAELLEQKLGYFGIKGEVMEVSPGPVITTFEYKPAPGIKISKIVNLADDLALALSAFSIRIVAPIPGKDVIGIEIPNVQKSLVPFMDIVRSQSFVTSRSKIPICLGKDSIGNPVVMELDKMPHLLIAGATGTGKSVGLNAIITSILYKSSPDTVNFIMIDPKRIELSLFNDIPHLLTPVITDMKKANIALQWVVREMERRYEKLAKVQVRNIEQYNEKVTSMDVPPSSDEDPFEPFSYIVVIIDELADLMMSAAKDIEFSLTRLAQMARAAGIHLVLATQRPSVDVLTGIIKANFPTRISFQVSSKTDSRTIIDTNGAETLLGSGDMLFVPPGTARLARVHGTFLSEEELVAITDFLKAQRKPDYIFDVITEKNEAPAAEINDDNDEKYQAALEFVVVNRQASISGVQRALRVGYNRAARIIDLMEKRGIIGPSDGVKPRQVLVQRLDDL